MFVYGVNLNWIMLVDKEEDIVLISRVLGLNNYFNYYD